MGKHSMTTAWKTFLVMVFGITLFLGGQAKAENRPSDQGNPYKYIASLGPILFGNSGGAFMPTSVLSSMKNGQISPIMQFVLVNNLMNSAVKEAQKLVPDRRDPFVVANQKFQLGLCKIKKAFEQGMLLALLPSLSANENNGGTDDPAVRQGSMSQAMGMMASFQKEGGCNGESDGGMDPMLMAMFSGGMR